MRIAFVSREHSAYSAGMQAAYACAMKKEEEQQRQESLRRARRRARLLALMKEVREQSGVRVKDPEDVRGIVTVIAESDSERTYLQAIASGKRGLGDKKAAELEDRYGKPPGWFDMENAAEWPFTTELQRKVLLLQEEELLQAENILRGLVRLPSISSSDFANSKHFSTGELGGSPYPEGPEDGAGVLDEIEAPASNKNGRTQRVQGPSRRKGGSGA